MASRSADDELAGKMAQLSASDTGEHGGDASGELSKPKKKKKAMVFDEPEETEAPKTAEPISAPPATRAEETLEASDAGAEAKKTKKKKKAMTFGDDAEGEAEEAPAVVPPTAAAPSHATSAGAGGLTDADRATGWVYTETPDEEDGLGEEEATKSAAAPAATEATAAEESKREWCKCKYHENFEMLGEMVNSEGVPALEALGAKFDVKVKLKDFTDPKPVRIRAKSAQEVKEFYNFICAMTEYLCQADGCKRLVPLETRHCERHKCTKKGCNGLAVFHNRCKKHNNER